MTEVQRLEKELGRAYRALRGLYSFVVTGETPDRTMLAYHSPTIAAAIRFVDEGSLDGAEYFIGKPFEVLQEVFAKSASRRTP